MTNNIFNAQQHELFFLQLLFFIFVWEKNNLVMDLIDEQGEVDLILTIMWREFLWNERRKITRCFLNEENENLMLLFLLHSWQFIEHNERWAEFVFQVFSISPEWSRGRKRKNEYYDVLDYRTINRCRIDREKKLQSLEMALI